MRRTLGIAMVATIIATVAAVLLPGGGSAALSDTVPLYSHFIGAMHEHSGYSDGFPGSEPRDYYASGKSYGLDFLAGSEHSDNAQLPMALNEECLFDPYTPVDCAVADKDKPEDSFRKWEATKEQAADATDESFTGIRGFEWSSDRFGHINVYMSNNDLNAYRDGGYVSMETFWEWFSRSPTLGGGADGLATFNHPGDKDAEPLDGFNWNSFEYNSAADQRMVGLEVYNDNDSDYDDEYEQYYIQALDAGWHVGAIGAEDLGHKSVDGDTVGTENRDGDDWGGPELAKTVMIATDKTASGLREALLARRFYAVKDNTLRLELTADGRPMGSRITDLHQARVPIKVEIWNETFGNLAPQTLATVEIVTNGGEVVDSKAIVLDPDEPELVTTVEVTEDERYYYARVLAPQVPGGKTFPLGYTSPIWIDAEAVPAREGQWLAGDLHIHTTYSHDAYGGPTDDNTGPEEFYTLGHPVTSQFAVALARGLDYLAITDHNDIRSQTDPGWQFAQDRGLIPIPGYESSLSGHAQFLGVTQCYESAGPYPGPDCSEHGDTSATGVSASAGAIRADGGVFQINHPADGSVDFPDDADWGLSHQVVPDTVEVWNISRLWQPPAPSGSSNDDAVRFWEGFLDDGFHVGATAGSDNHYLATTPVQGAGQPTTWVFAEDRTVEGVLEGLAAGRTFISHQPPALGGPQIFLVADGDGDGLYESMVGDTVPDEAPLGIHVVNGPGSLLEIVTDGGTLLDTVEVTSPDFFHGFTAEESTWVRAQIGLEDGQAARNGACDEAFGDQTTYCRNRLLVLAMTSAIYLDATPGGSEQPI